MKRMIATMAVAAVMTAGKAQAGEWSVYNVFDTGIGAVDLGSIRTDGSFKVAWSVSGFLTSQNVDGRAVDYFVDQMWIDCRARTYEVRHTVTYRLGEGQVHTLAANGGTTPALPDTAGDHLVDWVCVGPDNETVLPDAATVVSFFRQFKMDH